jgi:hypothetical protein
MYKRGATLALNKIVILILIVLAILLSLWALYRFGALDFLRDLFPDFSVNTTSENLYGG